MPQNILKFFIIAVLLTVVIMFAKSCEQAMQPYEFNTDNISLIQLDAPKDDQEIAILDTTLG